MKTQRNILIAFILNLSFAIFEFVGGIFTGSVAILSDSVHDIGDAASIGVSYFLEKKALKQPDKSHTYGYARYSVMGGFITTAILIVGSTIMIYNSIIRIINPITINYNGMIIFAVLGVCVNFCAAFFTREGDSLNQRAVNLHMLEDVLGWVVVLIGATVMRFTNFALIDPVMSIGVSVFIIINASRNLIQIANIFLEKTPSNIDTDEIKEHIKAIDSVLDVHHIHIWSMDGQNHYATMHVVTDSAPQSIKPLVREELNEHGIGHVTIELESSDEKCDSKECHVHLHHHVGHCHHHHSH